MKVTVNDEALTVADDTSVADVLTRLGIAGRGVAVAVDWSVLPRSQWQQPLRDGATVEIVTAVQGG